ncbi:MAG: hypothetical protein HY072_02385 [Deltaproteobacteria bacterium]|nr:hypothetical protein [Deltaproteobacteria bacterium]
MKINPFTGVPERFYQVTRKQDLEDGQSGKSEEHGKKHESKQNNEEEKNNITADPLQLENALQSFKDELRIQSKELEASLISSQLGLKVVLKDGTGAIVRQFSGEEFLKLREAATLDTRSRGKILDKKL